MRVPLTSASSTIRQLLWWGAPAVAVVAATWWTLLLTPVALLLLVLAWCGVWPHAWRRHRPVLLALTLLLGGASAAAAVHRWLDAGGTVAEVATAAERTMEEALAAMTTALREDASRSAAEGRASMTALEAIAADGGVVVYEDGVAVSWVGGQVLETEPLWEREGLAFGPFHTVAYAVAVRGARRVVATVVVHAAPPADRYARTLAADVARRTRAQIVVLPPNTPGATGRAVTVGGGRALVQAIPPDPVAMHTARDERSRVLGLVLVALAMLTGFVAYWRNDAPRWSRAGVLGLGVAVLGVVPLSAASNASRLFDAATFFSALGGPFTASIAALTLSSTMALLAVLAARRARMVPVTRGRRRIALAVALAFAAAAPYVLRDLARGVTMPPTGADPSLWLAWETGLFLAAMTLLTAGVLLGQQSIPRGRGLPLWVAPLIAVLAALLAPGQLAGDARWPEWYALLWTAAVAALVFARRSRAVLLPSALVAACGAVVLTWGATVRERVEMAAADIVGLGAVDEGSVALLGRFAEELLGAPPPRDRAALLRSYARAELAAGEYPVQLAHWEGNVPDVQVQLGASLPIGPIDEIVREARESQRAVLRELPPSPVASLVLAIPHPTHEVTTVVVSARSRLAAGVTRTPVIGVAAPSPDFLYELTLRPEAPALDVARTPWARRGDHLHAEWSMPSASAGAVRIHARVGFDALDALVPRGALIVLWNLAIVMMLWGADAAADGALTRWVRARRRRWRRSYRLQLSVALFAFFVVPAGGFAVWSSRRLAADDRATRELVVREYLRRATLVTGPAGPAVLGIPGDVPQFLYRRGRLVAASDPLQLAVAPIGRWIDPVVQRAIGDGEGLIATRHLRVGDRNVLFGFRPLGGEVVVAVPALVGDAALDQRRRDLGVLVLLTTLIGAIAALALSGFAARRLARPIGSLRDAALAVAGGRRSDIALPDTAVEFTPVFKAFDRMARDLAESEAQLARAQRVFAWGEMARQVAHEIKNPLTPMRLGVQHLLRAWRDGRPDFGTILEENATRVLTEIEHLDATARSFAQFGAPPDARPPVPACDVAAVVRDVAALQRLGGEERTEWRLEGADDPLVALARPVELREVLLNLAENARGAGARSITATFDLHRTYVRLRLADDGVGITPEALPRVFEPHFSTSSSGSGLGLAISRRLVEDWGGTIRLSSIVGRGTTVEILLRQPSAH